MTQAEYIIYQNEAIKQQVLSFLDWKNSDYCQFQEEMGYLYLEKEIGAENALFKALSQSKQFWSWWINHWIKRDIHFLSFKDSLKEETKELNYRMQHKPASILFEPHKAVLRNSYSSMLNKIKAAIK